jgi:hypothetical protein
MAFLKRFMDNENLRRRVIDLGIIDPLLFVQDLQWRELFIAGPTRSVVGTLSNDFPGLYYYDPRDQVEHILMFRGPIDWRFCKLDRRVVEGSDRKHHLLVGLFSDRKVDASVHVQHSEYKRTFLGGQIPIDRDAMPDQWEALGVLTRESFKLLPMPKAGEPYDWETAAEQCLDTLKKKRRDRQMGMGKVTLPIFFQSFESAESTYRPEPLDEYQGTAELICQAGLASSLLSYEKTGPKNSQAFKELGLSLEKTLKYFYDADTGFFHNTYPPRGDEWKRAVVDTWYTFHNLFHVLRAARLARDKKLEKLVHDAVNRVISFVHACNYQIPLFAKLSKAKEQGLPNDASVIGCALNPSVLGMYAMVLVEAADAFPEDARVYHDEAMKALMLLRRWPWHQMFHQTIQLSWAAWAAHRLGRPDWRDDFARCLLLCCYRQDEYAGLFQGCAGLSYPAFRETVEAVSPWIEWLTEAKELPLRMLLDLVLEKAQRFLSEGPHAGLPQEGLETREQPGAGAIGVAIYAAPQVFDLAGLQKKLIHMS